MREEDLFAEAIELPADERDAFLEKACEENAALRKSVEALISAHEVETAVVDRAVTDGAEIPAEIIGQISDEAYSMATGAQDEAVGATTPEDRDMVFGDYVLKSEVARGAMGVVYRAEQTSLNRTVAVKMIRSSMLASEEDVARFKMEAEAAAGLDHPNIVPIYDVGELEGQHYFSMKLIEGTTLDRELETLRRNPRTAVELMATVARAIHAAHQHGILHRDIKPANILIDQGGQPHVADFGLAKQIESNSSMTVSGQIMGTPFYMAPEQAEGDMKNVTTKADVYSLGALLYHALTGEPPHKGESLVETLQLVVNEEPRPPRAIDSAIDRDLATIAMKCLEKDPEKRYSSAAGLANDFDRWLLGEPIAARPVGAAERVVKWMRRKPVLAALWMLSLIFLLTLGIGGPIVAVHQAKLRGIADSEHDLAVEAGKKEAEARALAQNRADEIRRNLYCAEMNLVSQALMQPGGLRRFREFLDHWVPLEGEEDLRGWEWHFLSARQDTGQFSYRGHRSQVLAAAWSPKGDRVVSADFGGNIRAWDPDTGEEFFALRGENRGIQLIEWEPDGNRFLLGGQGGIVQVRDGRSGDLLAEGPRREADFGAAAWSPDGARIATGWSDGVILLIDAATGEETATIKAHRKLVEALAWSPDGAWLASGGRDAKIRFWDATTCKLVREVGEKSSIASLAWSSEGGLVASGSSRGEVTVRNGASGEVLFNLDGHEDRVAQIGWSPDGRRLASASWDYTTHIWDLAAGEVSATIRGIDKAQSVSWSPDGRRLAVAFGTEVTLYDAFRGDSDTLQGREGAAISIRWNPAGDRLAVFEGAHRAGVWNTETLTREAEFGGHRSILRDAAWSPDGKRVAAISEDGKILVREAATGETIHFFETGQTEGGSVKWSADGNRLMSIGDDSILRAWDMQSGAEVTGRELRVPVYTLSWSRDGQRLAIPDKKGGIAIVDAESLEERRRLEGPGRRINRLAWSPSGDRVAVSSAGGVILILDAEGRDAPLELAGHNNEVSGLAWSPDGTRLASGGADRSLRVWDTVAGLQCLLLHAHEQAITSVAWSGDGTCIASASVDGTIKLWDSEGRDSAEVEPAVADNSPPGKTPQLYADRLNSFASPGDWQRALTVLRGAVAEAPLDDRLHFQAATLFLYLEDEESYRAIRDAALAMDEGARSVDPANIAMTGLLLEDSGIDLRRLVALAEGPPPAWVEKGGNDKWTRVARALAAYRTERFDEAVALAIEDRDRAALGRPYEAQMLLIEAMAKAKRGDQKGASEAFHRAKALLDEKLGEKDSAFGKGWHNWLTGAILLREARRVMDKG